MSNSLIAITVLASVNILFFLALVILVIREKRRREDSSFDFNQVEINQQTAGFFDGLDLPSIAPSYGMSANTPTTEIPLIVPGAVIAGMDKPKQVRDKLHVPVA